MCEREKSKYMLILLISMIIVRAHLGCPCDQITVIFMFHRENLFIIHLSWIVQSAPAWVPSVRVSEGLRLRRSPGGVPGCTGLPGPVAVAVHWAGWALGYLKLRTSLVGAFLWLSARCPRNPSVVPSGTASYFRDSAMNVWTTGDKYNGHNRVKVLGACEWN